MSRSLFNDTPESFHTVCVPSIKFPLAIILIKSHIRTPHKPFKEATFNIKVFETPPHKQTKHAIWKSWLNSQSSRKSPPHSATLKKIIHYSKPPPWMTSTNTVVYLTCFPALSSPKSLRTNCLLLLILVDVNPYHSTSKVSDRNTKTSGINWYTSRIRSE